MKLDTGNCEHYGMSQNGSIMIKEEGDTNSLHNHRKNKTSTEDNTRAK